MNSAASIGAFAALAVMVLAVRCFPSRSPRRAPSVMPVTAAPWRRFVRRSRAAAVTDLHVAAWCEYAARALRGGHSITTALAQATDDEPAMRPTLAPVLAAIQRGQPVPDALDRVLVPRRRDRSTTVAAETMMGTVLRTCAELGGPAAAPLDRVAGLLRMRAALADEQSAQSAQARLSALVLTVVPLALLAVLVCADPRVRDAVTTPAGTAAITFGALLNGAGWCWMRRIIGAAQ